jgi:hypothetical protein
MQVMLAESEQARGLSGHADSPAGFMLSLGITSGKTSERWLRL